MQVDPVKQKVQNIQSHTKQFFWEKKYRLRPTFSEKNNLLANSNSSMQKIFQQYKNNLQEWLY